MLSAKRVGWRQLAPFGVLASVLIGACLTAGAVYLPHLFSSYASRYGVIGAVLAMISALFVLMVVIVASAAIGREVSDELSRIEHGERPPDDEIQQEWNALISEARKRTQIMRERVDRWRHRHDPRQAPDSARGSTRSGFACGENPDMVAIDDDPQPHRGRHPRAGRRPAGRARAERDHLRRAVLPRASASAAAERPPASATAATRGRRASRSPSNPRYVEWLIDESMLNDANAARQAAVGFREHARRTRSRIPIRARRSARAGGLVHRLSTVVRDSPGQSFLSGLADPRLWEAFAQIGIDAVHTGPVKKAGGSRRLASDAVGRRPLRPHQHAGRSGVRHRGRVPRRCARRPTSTAA